MVQEKERPALVNLLSTPNNIQYQSSFALAELKRIMDNRGCHDYVGLIARVGPEFLLFEKPLEREAAIGDFIDLDRAATSQIRERKIPFHEVRILVYGNAELPEYMAHKYQKVTLRNSKPY